MRLGSHTYRKNSSTYLVVMLFLLVSSLVSAQGVIKPTGEHEGEDVKQPIEFPHNIHVSDNDINCLYCHTYARRSKVAGIPPLSKCIGCHKIVAKDKPRIKKLTQYWNEGVSPRWKKVHDLPDFVHFTHERHLKKLLFDRDTPVTKVKYVCAICHGDVGEMTVAKKNKPLNMGWCVECHEKNSGPGDCWKCHK